MAQVTIQKARKFAGELEVPGDKSISHRAVMFGALAAGKTVIHKPLTGEDVLSTKGCFEAMGAKVHLGSGLWHVEGVGGLIAPEKKLDCGNSGTTMRLITGILAGQKFNSELFGDASLSQRPMLRVITPLEKMGAKIGYRDTGLAPLKINGSQLKGCEHTLQIASAQVKSALILAGLFAKGETVVRGEIASRDHTERLLPAFGVKLKCTEEEVRIVGGQELDACELHVPGDISSAAFLLVAAAIIPQGQLTVRNVSLNPTRTGILHVLERMGCKLKINLQRETPEPIGEITIKAGELVGTSIEADEVPALVDEIPVIAVLASQARGKTEVSGAEELRVKESDRLEAIALNLRSMGVDLELKPDGFIIEGPQKLTGSKLIKTFSDHRIAMAFSAGLVAEGETVIDDGDCVAISYPSFYKQMRQLIHAST